MKLLAVLYLTRLFLHSTNCDTTLSLASYNVCNTGDIEDEIKNLKAKDIEVGKVDSL